ncbi:hypothetical protein VTI74DRAFT_3324 [Chaetomium olivicolor]
MPNGGGLRPTLQQRYWPGTAEAEGPCCTIAPPMCRREGIQDTSASCHDKLMILKPAACYISQLESTDGLGQTVAGIYF